MDVIAAPGGAPVALAAKSATTTIPIVFEMGGDPIVLGIVDSLSRPGGNLTGISSLSVEVSGKRLEFMHDALPAATVFAVVANPTSPTAPLQLRNLHTAAEKLGTQLHVLYASTEQEFDNAFTALSQLRVRGLVFTSDPYFANRSQQLAALAVRHAVPAITIARLPDGWRPDELRRRFYAVASTSWHLCWTCPQWREAFSVTGAAGHEGGVFSQSQGSGYPRARPPGLTDQ